ncbi:helix-turn-helix domain-containing protein [Streptomyces orinoci]|uniref:Helix-turn-helix domain-containing protein n=1 Tax=Streptomyces orinoci TaxID=67339 RepID=A0ABV3JUY0_STRON|nr:helix-turn-helix domain-containing protein [Streptomyces orinoci]
MASDPILLDARETALLLNVSLSWLYRDAPKQGLRGYKLGGGRNAKIKFKKTDVLKWLEQRRI